MEPREKNAKRVAQGKRLAAYDRERLAWMKEERRKHEEEEKEEEEEEEEGLTTFKEGKEEEGKEEGKERSCTSANLLILPAVVVVVGVGVLWCLRKPEGKEKEELPKPRPRILQRPRLERL